MSKDEKISLLAEILEIDKDTLCEETVLKDLEQWDSLAVISFISFVEDNFGRTVAQEDIVKCNNVNDLLSLME